MFPLLVCSSLWLCLSVGAQRGEWRTVFLRYAGEKPFRVAFSMVSATLIGVMVILLGGAQDSNDPILWAAPVWTTWLIVWPMTAFAFVLFALGIKRARISRSGQETAILFTAPYGVTRITRHPLPWAVALWSSMQMLTRGDLASLIFFGSIAACALLLAAESDRRLADANPGGWAFLAANTSSIPFGAILTRRNRLVTSELDPTSALLGILTFELLAWLT